MHVILKRSLMSAVILALCDDAIPRLVAEGNDALSQTPLSFSRSARESPGWFHHGNDSILLRPSTGDPRFARMTVETATLPRPLLGVCP